MRYLQADQLVTGLCVAQDVYVYYPIKVLLVPSQTQLNEEIIFRIKLFEVEGLYVFDGISDDIVPDMPVISNQLKSEAIVGLKNIFDLNQDISPEAMKEKIEGLSGTVNDLINGMVTQQNVLLNIETLKSHDEYTYHHCLSVAVLAIATGIHIGLSNEQLFKLGLASILHDVGKIVIPIDVLNKPSRLTNEEFQMIKTHSESGAEYLTRCGMADSDILEAVLTHHERWDGTGYPRGLAGEEIPLLGRIISVCDVYDALTSDRPYRTPDLNSYAVEYLMANCETMFDYSIVKEFLNRVEFYPLGTKIKLSNGEYYIVIKNSHSLRPVVRSVNNPEVVIDLFWDRNALNLVVVKE